MMREWKPGDVARVSEGVVTFYENEYTTEVMFTSPHGYQHPARHLSPTADPLVVIDPEDREQVERLADLNERHTPDGSVSPTDSTNAMQAALREFANPTPPKPEEPTGLGAVVEDAGGDTWTRNAGARWLNLDGGSSSSSWSDLRAVRVIFEGVTS